MASAAEHDRSAADPDPAKPPRLMPAAAEQRRGAVALAIEQVALDLFAERPMAEVTVNEVATRAGVALRTFYRYFPTKEHVFSGVPRRGAERLCARIEARPAKESPFQALRKAVADTGLDFDTDELSRWLKAYGKSGAQDRIAPLALVASAEAMTEALSRRARLEPGELWPMVAGNIAATALTVGTRHWAEHGGDLTALQLAALDIAGRGLRHLS